MSVTLEQWGDYFVSNLPQQRVFPFYWECYEPRICWEDFDEL